MNTRLPRPFATKHRFYRNYLLAFLIVLIAFNYADYVALGIALQSIKTDLHLSDTQLGLLSGIAFTFFYAAFGIPMGRWADRGNRVTVLCVSRLLWSVFVIFTGRATSFFQLLIIRAGAAVGESGCLPPAFSLISDYFSREERPRAIGFLNLGSPCASLIGFFAAGWLMQLFGWRLMFAMIGLPVTAFTIIARLTLKDPRGDRQSRQTEMVERPPNLPSLDETQGAPTQLPFWQAFRSLYANATYRNLLFAMMISNFFGATLQWSPAYFAREYGLKSGALGTWFALVYGVPGLVGTALGGIVASQWAKRNEGLQLKAVAVLYCLAALTLTAVYWTNDYRVAFLLIGLSSVTFTLQAGPTLSALQTVVPSRLRAVSLAIMLLFLNLIGAGLGPLFIGTASDLLRPLAGAESLRYSLSLLAPWLCLSSIFAWRASKSALLDIEAAKAATETESAAMTFS